MTERNIGEEILEAIRDIKSGQGKHKKIEIPEDLSDDRLDFCDIPPHI